MLCILHKYVFIFDEYLDHFQLVQKPLREASNQTPEPLGAGYKAKYKLNTYKSFQAVDEIVFA